MEFAHVIDTDAAESCIELWERLWDSGNSFLKGVLLLESRRRGSGCNELPCRLDDLEEEMDAPKQALSLNRAVMEIQETRNKRQTDKRQTHNERQRDKLIYRSLRARAGVFTM